MPLEIIFKVEPDEELGAAFTICIETVCKRFATVVFYG